MPPPTTIIDRSIDHSAILPRSTVVVCVALGIGCECLPFILPDLYFNFSKLFLSSLCSFVSWRALLLSFMAMPICMWLDFCDPWNGALPVARLPASWRSPSLPLSPLLSVFQCVRWTNKGPVDRVKMLECSRVAQRTLGHSGKYHIAILYALRNNKQWKSDVQSDIKILLYLDLHYYDRACFTLGILKWTHPQIHRCRDCCVGGYNVQN